MCSRLYATTVHFDIKKTYRGLNHGWAAVVDGRLGMYDIEMIPEMLEFDT